MPWRKYAKRSRRRAALEPSGPATLELWRRWAAHRKLDAERVAAAFGITPDEEFVWRPRVVLATDVGVPRYRYLDRDKPKAVWHRGGRAHWYGLRQALELGTRAPPEAPEPLYIVNGEPSVWACWQSGVAAVSTGCGEGTIPRELEELVGLGRPLAIVYDRDRPGQRGARELVRVLVRAGALAARRVLPEGLGRSGDVDDLHRRVGDDGLADALAALDGAPAHAALTPSSRRRS
jgi:hypothetical protein